MSWRKKFSDNAGDTLRFIGYLFLFLDAIVFSAFSLWFIGKFIWFFACWLDRVVFGNAW